MCLFSQTIAFKAGAYIRRSALAERFARNFAVRLANMLLCLVAAQLKSFVARAYARRSASPIDACLLADWFADVE